MSWLLLCIYQVDCGGLAWCLGAYCLVGGLFFVVFCVGFELWCLCVVHCLLTGVLGVSV